MKAVLEFGYPEDEERLRYALHSEGAFTCLLVIEKLILENADNKVPRVKTLQQIQELVRNTLSESGIE